MSSYSGYRSALDDALMDPNQEVSIKVKPLQAITDTGGAASGVQGGSGASVGGGGTVDMPRLTMGGGGAAPAMPRLGATPGASADRNYSGFGSAVKPSQRLSQNPMLITHPLGAQTDAEYEAAIAQLQQRISSQYAGILRELGFVDSEGNFTQGLLETEAARQRAELERQQALAREQVTQNAQRGGTVFSGRRAVLQAQAEQPYVSGLANLETQLSQAIGDRYTQASDLMRQFTVDRDALIAAAAQRAHSRIMQNPVGQAQGTPPPADYYTGPGSNLISPATAAQMNQDEYTPFPILPGANALLAFK